MKILYFLAGFAALAITVSSAVYADEIYKWTDEDGNVHYEDRPSGAPSEQRLQFSYNRTDSTAVDERVKAQRDVANTRLEARADKDAEDQTIAEERAAAEKKLEQCQQYRASLKVMLESRRVYREDEAGERTYLDDTARAEARTKAEELIKETCSS